MDPKRYSKAYKWAGCIDQCLSMKKKLLHETFGPSLKRNGPKEPENSFFLYCFSSFWGHLGTPKQSQKVDKGLQVCRIYGLISNLKNKPPTKSLGPFFKEKWF
jgi:hypothetical protein